MKKINSSIPLIILLTFSFILNHNWILHLTFGAGDWRYFFPAVLKNWPFRAAWVTAGNLGNINYTLWRLPSELVYWLAPTSQWGDKLWVFIPYTLLLPLSAYLFLRLYFRKNISLLAGGLFFVSNTYFLAINSQGHLPLSIAACLMLIAFVFYKKYFDTEKISQIIVAVLFLFLTGIYDFRFAYIGGIVFIMYTLFYLGKMSKKKFRDIIMAALLLILVNLYWLIPATMVGVDGGLADSLFGGNFWTLSSAITMHHPFWPLISKIDWFVVQPIPFFYWLFPLFAWAGFVFNRKNKDALFFAMLAIVGIFLSKLTNAPLGSLYSWAFATVPGWHAFRESSKFYVLIIVSYSFLISALVETAPKKIALAVLGILIACSIAISLPVILNRAGEMYEARQIPPEYTELGDTLQKQKEFYRTVWSPTFSRWSYASDTHPKVSQTFFNSGDWTIPGQYDPSPLNEKMNFYRYPALHQFFDILAVKYFIVPLQEPASDLFIYYGERQDLNVRQWYISELSKIKWLTRVDLGSPTLAVFENKDWRDHLYLTADPESILKVVPAQSVKWQFINPAEYQVTITGASSTEILYLNFSEAYHPAWKIRVGEFSRLQALLHGDKYFLPSTSHYKNAGALNSFKIDPLQICASFHCVRNEDGTIDMDLTVYFTPQSYYYLGAIISGLFLVGSLLYLIFRARQGRRKKNETQF